MLPTKRNNNIIKTLHHKVNFNKKFLQESQLIIFVLIFVYDKIENRTYLKRSYNSTDVYKRQIIRRTLITFGLSGHSSGKRNDSGRSLSSPAILERTLKAKKVFSHTCRETF